MTARRHSPHPGQESATEQISAPLAAKAASSPQPSLVLLAYAAAGIVALLPLTPGGLGLVEASLSGLLVLAGVRAGYAVLAILAYRIASYWLPLLAGPPSYLLFRHRYGPPVRHPAMPGARGQPPPDEAVSP
jgi:Lysylphosphatidylglycerol synthase TM region